jgi:hypothetical protein
VNDSLLHKVATTGEHLFHDLYRVAFSQFFLLLYVLLQITVGTVLHNDVEVIGGLDNFVESDHVVMHQLFMNVDFGLQHLQIGASKFLELDDLDCIAFVDFLDFNPFVNLAGESFPEIVIGGIFINANFDLIVLESMEFFQSFFLGVVAGQRLVLIVARLHIAAECSHRLYIVILLLGEGTAGDTVISGY